MSDIRPAIEHWQKRISASTGLAGVVVAGFLAAMLGLGIAGYGIRNAIVHSAFVAETSGGAGTAWFVSFLAMAAPGIAFSLACVVFVSTYRAWSFVGLVLSIALIMVVIGAAAPPRSKNDPPVEPLTEILVGLGAALPIAETMSNALWVGALTTAALFVGGIAWGFAVAYFRSTPQLPGSRAPRARWLALAFQIAYPVAIVTLVPLIAITGMLARL